MSTPLMRQYQKIKSEYPNAVLLFRMGDFFETFEEDALITSRVLGITLTKRSNGAAREVPLAGFPHHALDTYLPKLVRAGYRVAVCEQMEDPKLAKGIVRREVVEVVTPGVVLNDKLLDHRQNNYLAALVLERGRAGLAWVDVSTGDFTVTEVEIEALPDHLASLMPREVLLSRSTADDLKPLLTRHLPHAAVTRLDDWLFARDVGYEIALSHFKTPSLKGFGIEDLTVGVTAVGVALHYLRETQRSNLMHVAGLRHLDPRDVITLDTTTRRNLEILGSPDEGPSSLLAVLDKTSTPMGARLLRSWITHPLRSLPRIHERLDAVRELSTLHEMRQGLVSGLESCGDLDRLVGRTCTGRALPRELVALKRSLLLVPSLRRVLTSSTAPLLRTLSERLDPCEDVTDRIERILLDEPALSPAEGGVIRPGVLEELDEMRELAANARAWMERYQEDLRASTGISSLRIEFNRAFGYSISVSKANVDKVPEGFLRRQTLVNGERYITPELKEFEDKVLHARDQIATMETELFNDLRAAVSLHFARMQETSKALAALDCVTCFALAALEYEYTCPVVNDGTDLTIIEGRHPVIERLLPPGERFVSNDLHLDDDERIMILTGPNMSGKSTYLRQVGLIVLLAQVGSFVPATSAVIGCTDRIFTRVGASDNIAAGESTFLVEMQEAANILHNATPRSVILLDEIGRGTSTFDGISIAWAITEHLHDHPASRARTLFATHYHELNEMASIFPRIVNYKVEVREFHDKVIFLRTVSRGTADHSYGIQVAQMAGLPPTVIARAKAILHTLEGQDLSVLAGAGLEEARGSRRVGPVQISLFEAGDLDIRDRLRDLDIQQLSPVQAWQLLEELQRLARGETPHS